MSLHDMPVEPAICRHTAFQIHQVTSLQFSEIRSSQCFVNGCYPVLIFFYFHHSKTNAIMGNALIYMQFGSNGRREKEMHVVSIGNYFFHPTHAFYDSCKHYPCNNFTIRSSISSFSFLYSPPVAGPLKPVNIFTTRCSLFKNSVVGYASIFIAGKDSADLSFPGVTRTG